MTKLPELNTPFRRLAHKLPSPLATRFNPKVWEEAFASCDPTEGDHRLLCSAMWIGRKAHTLLQRAECGRNGRREWPDYARLHGKRSFRKRPWSAYE